LQDARALTLISDLLRGALDALQQPDVIEFRWHDPQTFMVNGVVVPCTTRGLIIAWMTLAGAQSHHEPIPADAWFGGRRPAQSVWQAIQTATKAVGAVSPDLAKVIDRVRLSGGTVRLKAKTGQMTRVRCTAGPWLSDIAQRMQEYLAARAAA
jgi:hypothetical protein